MEATGVSNNDAATLSLLGGYGGIGYGGRGNDVEQTVFEVAQSIKDQSTNHLLYEDNKNERRNDRIDMEICENSKEGIRQTGAIITAIKDCCCENQVALANLNGKVDLNAEKALNATLQSEMRTNAAIGAIATKMDADTIANFRQNELLKANSCNFAERGFFPVTTTCAK